MSCGINVTNLVYVESLANFNDVCDCCAEGSIIYVNDENAFYQIQYGQKLKKVYLPFIKRDSNGRAQIVAPAAADDIANKKYVDDLVSSKDIAIRQYVDTQVSANSGINISGIAYWPSATGTTNLYLPPGGIWLWMISTTHDESFTNAGISTGGSLIYDGHNGSGIAIRLS